MLIPLIRTNIQKPGGAFGSGSGGLSYLPSSEEAVQFQSFSSFLVLQTRQHSRLKHEAGVEQRFRSCAAFCHRSEKLHHPNQAAGAVATLRILCILGVSCAICGYVSLLLSFSTRSR